MPIDNEDLKRKFGTGALPSPRDPRDYVFAPAARGVTDPFDWELGFDVQLIHAFRLRCATEADFFGKYGREGWGYDRYKEIVDYCKKKGIDPKPLKVNDQNGSGSCVGQSQSKYKAILDLVETGLMQEKSAHDHYSYIYVGDGGAYPREGMDRMVKVGIADESIVPSYNNGKPPSEAFMRTKAQDTPEVLASRKAGRAKSYLQVQYSPTFMDDIAWAMLLNFGSQYSIAGDWKQDWHGDEPDIGDADWHHAIFGGKATLRHGAPFIGILNSWGKNIGDNGWQYLNAQWFKSIGGWSSRLYEAWTVQDQTNKFDYMKSNSRVIKLIYPDGHTEMAIANPATNPQGFISMTRNAGIEIPLKPDQYGNKDNDVQWDKVKVDGEAHVQPLAGEEE